MAADFKTAQPLEYYRKFLEENIRPDGRDLLEFRKTILNVGSISTAEGSALVKLGNTTVVCGVKAEFAVPSQENPNHGYIVPNVDLPPLCSSRFRPGPPNEQAQVLSQFVADTISNCEPVNLKDLCILEGKIQGELSHYQFLGCQRYSINTVDDRGTDIRISIQILIILLAHIELGMPVPLLLCWVLYVDVVCLSYDGNITDASLIAAIAALKNTQLHAVTINEESQTPEPSETRDISLTIRNHPIAATFGIFDDSVLFADPTDEEEGLLTGVVTIVVMDDEKIAAVHKPGGSPLPDHKFQECYKKALTRGKEVRDLIQTACVDVDR